MVQALAYLFIAFISAFYFLCLLAMSPKKALLCTALFVSMACNGFFWRKIKILKEKIKKQEDEKIVLAHDVAYTDKKKKAIDPYYQRQFEPGDL